MTFREIKAILLMLFLGWLIGLRKNWRAMCAARAGRRVGYTFVGHAGLDFLGALAEPPWTAFHGGLGNSGAHEALVVERRGGDIFSAHFSARLIADLPMMDRARPIAYTIVGLRLAPGAAHTRVKDFINGLELNNGLCLNMRADCIYALFYPGPLTRICMPLRQRIAIMAAMEHLAAGQLNKVSAILLAQSGRSLWVMFFWIPLMLAVLCGFLMFLMHHPDPWLAGGGVAVALFIIYVLFSNVHEAGALDAYLERRVD